MLELNAVIFDMDGLMIDSERVTFEGYKHVLAKQNLVMKLLKKCFII